MDLPREYCSEACERYERRKAVHTLFGGPEPKPPEEITRRTPGEMEERIADLKWELKK